MLHRLCAIAAAVLALATAAMFRRHRLRLASAFAIVIMIATGLGLVAVSPRPALPVVAHNSCAAILVALLAAASTRGPDERIRPRAAQSA